MESISGIRDVDRQLISSFDDREIITTCSLNKYLNNVVCDNNFFFNLLKQRYPDTLKYINTKDYKRYYLSVVYYVSKMKEDYDYDYKSGNPKIQFDILKEFSKLPYLVIESAILGELDLLKYAANKGYDLRVDSDIALRKAVENGHLDVVKYLVSQGLLLTAWDIVPSSLHGHLDVVKYLVDQGADIHLLNDIAVRYASRYGYLDVVKYLVDNGANIRANDDESLRQAREKGHTEIVNYIESLQ